MRRPLIGMTAYAQQVQYGGNDIMAGMLPMTYVRAVHSAGGRAVLITPDDPDIDVIESLDGIVFSGGGDVDPAHWGAEPHPLTDVDRVRALDPERDPGPTRLHYRNKKFEPADGFESLFM